MLAYESTSRIRGGVLRVIQAEASALQRPWWRGGLGFDVEGEPAILRGSTPLFHRSSLIPEPDDLFMAFCDAVFLTGLLAQWATQHTIKWRLRMHDEDWGAVDPSGISEVLSRSMNKWARRVKVPIEGRGGYLIPEERRQGLLIRHSSRQHLT